MTAPAQRLYKLLPALYRNRDTELDGPLAALLAALEVQVNAVERDIGGLYENWFIETCAEWVVPYIGDLLGTKRLHPGIPGIFSQRAFVANTLAYRRRKGTCAVLEQVARDVTGWPAKGIEFSKCLALTQHVNHVRPGRTRTPDLRDMLAMDRVNGPFDSAAHLVEVRRLTESGGRYGPNHVGICLWSTGIYQLEGIPARALPGGGFSFHPLGYPAPLFNLPVTETDIAHLVEEINVPGPLRQVPLHVDLEAWRATPAQTYRPGDSVASTDTLFYGPNRALAIFEGGTSGPRLVDPRLVYVNRAPGGQGPDPAAFPATARVVVDPLMGRFWFVGNPPDGPVTTRYTYGFGADLGGGSYPRRTIAAPPKSPLTFSRATGEPVEDFLGRAAAEWHLHQAEARDPQGRIELRDEHVHAPPPAITMGAGAHLRLSAAEECWPMLCAGADGVSLRINLPPSGTAVLDLVGLLIEGRVELLQSQGNGALELNVEHCTMVPGGGRTAQGAPAYPGWVSLFAPADLPGTVQLTLRQSIAGSLRLPAIGNSIRMEDSILDAADDQRQGGGTVIEAADGKFGPPATFLRSTLLGAVRVQQIASAQDCLFTGSVTVQRTQVGGMRFCHVPEHSRTPRRFRCQPGQAMAGITDTQETARLRHRLRPIFRSTEYGHPQYAQLDRTCAREVLTGAEDGAEFGVFCQLKRPQREGNIETSIPDFMPLGFEAGLWFVNVPEGI